MKTLAGAIAAGVVLALITVGVVAFSGSDDNFSHAPWYYSGVSGALGYWMAKWA